MKQIILKYLNGSIRNKYYINNLNQLNDLFICYCNNGNIYSKINYLNDKQFGIGNYYNYNNNKPTKRIYHI